MMYTRLRPYAISAFAYLSCFGLNSATTILQGWVGH